MTKQIDAESIDAAKVKAFIKQDKDERMKRCAERIAAILEEERCQLSPVTVIRAGVPIEVRVEIVAGD